MVEALMYVSRRSYLEGYKQAIRDIGKAAEEQLGERGTGLKEKLDTIVDELGVEFNQ